MFGFVTAHLKEIVMWLRKLVSGYKSEVRQAGFQAFNNVLHIAEINQEKTIQGIAGFDKGALKHATTTVKSGVPSKEGEDCKIGTNKKSQGIGVA